MDITSRISVPTLVRMKPGALDRLGLYLQRPQFRRPALFYSEGMIEEILSRAHASLREKNMELVASASVAAASLEDATAGFTSLSPECDSVIGLGGGKALDTAKYIAFLARKPYYAVPTSLSNDGFCSPGSSLTVAGRRRSLPSALPYAVIVDTDVCLNAPVDLWRSGVGDLMAKITAVHDWKLAFHARGERVEDLAALLSDATVMQFIASPTHDTHGVRLLATALMLNGIAMEICGSSRPASGSEHLISHALDELTGGAHLHGVQVGLATYLVSQLQQQGTERIASVFDRTGFWDTVRARPFQRAVWLDAVRRAPSVKQNFYTVLSEGDPARKMEAIIDSDPKLEGCFT